ncbi:MAG: ribose 5-phosphate isomerase A [Chloroflexi bacterium]|nr:ribose 5-phosphate isomerase A [Chloroflexota bacterium]
MVGLGSGSTARYATLRIAKRLREGSLRGILAIATSNETAALAQREGIPLTTLEEHPIVDITLDGADEIDPQLNVIKGLGGFLLREKIVAFATRLEVIVADGSKWVPRLGTRSPVPVEVVRFGWQNTLRALERTGAKPTLRCKNGQSYLTDEGHLIIDCLYEGGIKDPASLHNVLNGIPGVVDNGLFLGMVHRAVIATSEGVRVVERA